MSTSEGLKAILDGAVTASNLGTKTWCGQTYTNVFTGETLVNMLLKESAKYPSRETAVQYAQSLLDSCVITSITKRGAFDDGDRLYYINQNARENGKIGTTTKVSPKVPNTKLGEKKETVLKENGGEINLRGNCQNIKSSLGREPVTSSAARTSPSLLRLLEKDSSQINVRVSATNVSMASSEKQSGRKEQASVTVVLKDKQTESHKDDKLPSKINSVPNKMNSENNKTQSLRTGLSSAEEQTALVQPRLSSGKPETDERLTLAPPETHMGNGSQNCIMERDSANHGKLPGNNADATSAKDKQKVTKTLSPALTALIEKDAKNSQSNQHKSRKEENKLKHTSDVPVSNRTSGKNDDLSSSWEEFELKLQNKIKKSLPKQSLASDTRDGHEGMHARKHEESGVTGDESNGDKVERKPSFGKQSSAAQETEKSKEQERLFSKSGKVMMPSVAARTKSFESPERSTKSKQVNVTGSFIPGSDDGNAKDRINEENKLVVKSDNVLKPPVTSKKNSFVLQECGETDTASTVKVPSVCLNDNSECLVIDEIGSNCSKPSRSSSLHSEDSRARKRGPSFSLSDDLKTVVIEDTISVTNSPDNNELVIDKEDGGNRSRGSSFNLKSESKKLNTTSQNMNQSSEAKPSVQRKDSQTSVEAATPNKKQNPPSFQENLMRVEGRVMPKTLAALLSRDGSASEKKDHVTESNDTNLYRNKLKELKRSAPHPSSPVPKSAENEELWSGKSTSDHSNGKDDALAKTEEKEKPGIQNTATKGSVRLAVFRANSMDDEKNVEATDKGRSPTVEHRTSLGTSRVNNAKPGTSPSGSFRTSGDQTATNHEPISPSSEYVIPRLNRSTEELKSASVGPTRPSSLPFSPTSKSSPHADDSSSPSQLRRELERNRQDFEESKRKYENKITELQLQIDFLRRQKSGQIDENENFLENSASTSDLTSLFSSFSTPMVSPGDSDITSPNVTPRMSMNGDLIVSSPKTPPPPPPAPPSVPVAPSPNISHIKPNKPVVNPKADMRPLFWNRIVTSEDSDRKNECLWESIKEPVIDTAEFERLFSKKSADRKLKRTKSLRDDKHFAHIHGKKVVKLLDADRSRAIGIKMSSLSCELKDIRNAVFNMDATIVDMDSLQCIYDIYPKAEEIQLIQDHVKRMPSVPLDKPEEFMHQLTKMEHFKERLECWLFEEKFSEIMYGIDRSLACVTESCSIITSNAEITSILALVLVYGNYMNGNTIRGQADGFHLDVLLKLRDVKAKDSDMNLLQYIVRQYLKQHERGLEKSTSGSRLPSSVSLSSAAQVSFETLKEELQKVSSLLSETELQVKRILDESSPAQRNPFEEKMRKFQTNAKKSIAEKNEMMKKTQEAFQKTVEYFKWEPDGKKETPQEFFSLWAKFMEEVKNCVKMEKQQLQISKRNFSKVEHLNQIREAATKFRKRRQSVDVL